MEDKIWELDGLTFGEKVDFVNKMKEEASEEEVQKIFSEATISSNEKAIALDQELEAMKEQLHAYLNNPSVSPETQGWLKNNLDNNQYGNHLHLYKDMLRVVKEELENAEKIAIRFLQLTRFDTLVHLGKLSSRHQLSKTALLERK
ncbi:hypothetical protein D3X11_04935 [Streptococcus sp. X16XC17]|uniref:hypothetical protein n=1 Tax=unclassified Streptococcus TaxID=2608887 RepID=UPI00066FBC46|nr:MULTISPECIES: hypothetical protein [unclassified Streptococcus]TCD46716.1 hypothetical protein D3X11_04935 [Streptococcus sp. X16XC17]